MRKKQLLFILILLLVVTISASFFLTRETKPSADTRVILDHTSKTYIAPTCFEDAEATNFLSETTLQEAYELNYQPHSACTENALKSE